MKSRQSRNQVLAISAILGAVIGAIAGITLLKRVEQEGEERPLLTGVEGMSLGMLVVGLLRQVSNLGKPGKK
ncbi:MAG: hypothetical protein WD751_10510 [Anaerolineales bacterium]